MGLSAGAIGPNIFLLFERFWPKIVINIMSNFADRRIQAPMINLIIGNVFRIIVVTGKYRM